MVLNPGTVISVDHDQMQVGGLLGSGGEGEVYELTSRTSGRRLALKWYHQHTATPERRADIAALITRGSPSDRFLWPQGLIEDRTGGRFGYVMGLRPDSFVGMAAILRGDVPRQESKVVRFAFELAMAFRELHLEGLCYRDINFGNTFMDQATGAALICDNDNVSVEGVGVARVLGSRKFMAPEIVRREALPSKFTDRFSLAVLLFYLLIVHHPLEGRRTEVGLADTDSDLRHYGFDPLFCFDPSDTSNRPDPQFHPHVEMMWATLPDQARRLFMRSFSEGLMAPERRVVDSEWCAVLADMWSGLIVCETCGAGSYLTLDGRPHSCGRCGQAHGEILAVRAGEHLMVVRHGSALTGHHLRGDFDFTRIIGTVERHPSQEGVFGFRNDGDRPLQYVDRHGRSFSLAPGKRARLAEGARIDFGSVTGVVTKL